MARNLRNKKIKKPLLIIAFVFGILLLLIPLKIETNLGLLPETGEELDLSVEIIADKEHIQNDSPRSEDRIINYTVKAVNNSECIKKNLDIIFLIDSSGSISDKLSQMKQDAKKLLDYMDFEKDKTGIVTFNESASLLQGITQDKNDLINSLSSLSSSKMSNLGEGIDFSVNELISDTSDDTNENIIIIFSDGLADRPSEGNTTNLEYAKNTAYESALRAQETNIKIYTISYGDFADDNFLETLSVNGSLVRSNDENSIKSIYASITHDETTTIEDTVASVDLNAVEDIIDINSISNGGILSNGKLGWAIGSLQCKQTSISQFSLSINDNAVDLDKIDLAAELHSNDINPQISESVITTIHAPNLNFSVTDNAAQAQPGETLNYEIYIENKGTGNANLANVVTNFTDPFEVNQTSYVGALLENHTLTWDNAGEGFMIDGSHEPSGSEYGNSLSLTYSGTVSSALEPEIYTIETISTLTTESGSTIEAADDTLIPYVPDLYIVKKSKPPTYTYGGGIVIYTLEIGNEGYIDATDIAVTDEFNPLISSVRAENARISNDKIVWKIESLAIGESSELTYNAIINEQTGDVDTISNSATISSSVSDYDTSDNVSFKDLKTTKSPILDIEKSTEALSFDIGSEFEISFSIYNNSYADSYHVILEEELPGSMEYVNNSAKLNEETYSNPQGEHTLRWDLGDVATEESLEFVYKVKIDPSCKEGNYYIPSQLLWQDINQDAYSSVSDSVTISVLESTTSIPESLSANGAESEEDSKISIILMNYQEFIDKLPVTGESLLFMKIVLSICLAIPLPIMLIFEKKKSKKSIKF